MKISRQCLYILLLASASGALAAALTKPTGKATDCFIGMTKTLNETSVSNATPLDIAFFGDSITESWRGTDRCESCEKLKWRTSCTGVPAVFAKHYGNYTTLNMGMGFDQVANLMWRLQNGHMPTVKPPKLAVLLVGTNDLGATAWSLTFKNPAGKKKALATAVPGIAGRIQQTVQMMRKAMPKTKVLVLGLLPRSTDAGMGVPIASADLTWPSVYTDAIASINSRLSAFTRTSKALAFLDCGPRFLERGGKAISRTLMPDGVHPSAAGFEQLAQCLDPQIKALVGR